MSGQARELKRLYERFGSDTKTLLSEYPTLENLRVFSDRREGLLEWYGFREGASLLAVGSGAGALTGMLLRKGLSVTVLEEDPDAMELTRLRAEGNGAERLTLLSAGLSGLPADRIFDYILFDGTLGKGDAAAVEAAKRHLAPDGILIAAADNAYGVRAFAGAEKEENAIGKAAFESLLQSGEAGSITRYYAEPMRAMPLSIYSDRYLPGAGELSRVIPAYGFPAYLAIDLGAKYDEICSDGVFPEFADSFLFFWKREAGAEAADGSDPDGKAAAPAENTAEDPAVFVKYNRNRRDCYQLKTVIREGKGGRTVEKGAVSAAGVPHIRAFADRFRTLSNEEGGISYAEARISPDGMTASFPWVRGESLTDYVLRAVRAGAAAEDAVRAALDRVTGFKTLHNLDSIFDNFLVTGAAEPAGTNGNAGPEKAGASEAGKEAAAEAASPEALLAAIRSLPLTGIDYEWVSEAPADPGFVRYRALLAFWLAFHEPLGLKGQDDFLAAFGIEGKELVRVEAMERAFQEDVAGDDQAAYLDRFTVEVRSRDTIEKTERDLRIANERLDGFRAELREKDTTIRKMTEVKRLTDNHVTNLEIIIGNLRNETNELGKTLTYLDKHQTVYSRLRRKAGDAFNRKYPKGSNERKKLQYRKEALLHPIRQRKLMNTPEGRNRIEGDFAIGDIYLEHGKLHFPKTEAPVVSIVIPVYNQIGYTYACLVSILEHTKDIPYEVIIADDVSTDATKVLDHFAEGLVISRNTVNQGFLKNCNQAAAKARGEFIFFLNNDTKVTEGWLDWLLRLIRSDKTIGMVGSKLVYPDGRLQEAGGIIWSDASGWNYGRLQDPDLPEFNYVKDVDYMSGAAIMIRRSLWEEIGGFDERYAPAYCEDSDLAFEVRKHGYRVVYQPKSVVIHFEGVSNGTDVQGTGLKRYQIENTEKLKEKWKEELKQQFENDGNPDPFRARERSGGKKIILVVDHYVPTFDRDAGSRTTWQYLQMFVKKGYQVKFLGDNFAAEEPYTTALTQLGIEVLYGQAMQAGIWEWIERHANDIHLVYLNRPHIASKYIDFIQSRTHLKVIYYGHDLHFLRERREYELTGDRKLRESSEYWKTVELSLMHKADMSYYPSEVECEAIRRVDRTIPVKAITAYLWDSFPEDTDRDFEKREGLLFVGGFAHPPNADAVLWFVREVWPKLQADRAAAGKPAMNFYIVGSRAPEEIKALHDPENGVVVKGFVTDEELRTLYNSTRIVVVPLRYGAGVKGKVIEALYYGAPVITTGVGAEGIPEAETVMEIADAPEAFADRVNALYDDTAALAGMQEKAEEYIRSHNSLDAAWRVIEDDF